MCGRISCNRLLALSILLQPLFHGCFAAPTTRIHAQKYAVLFDAGSTGTRVHVYKYVVNPISGAAEVTTNKEWSQKVTPGLSAYEAQPAAAGTSIKALLRLAESIVPASEHADALLMLRATAGMRILPAESQRRIYDAVFDAVTRSSAFRPCRENFATLSGEEEGVFGWLAVNYLLQQIGRLSNKELGSVGALDLGGGSTQITFRSASEKVSDPQVPGLVPVHLPHRPRPAIVFSESHLGFGNKAA
eukprot:6039370-Pleurochrysis_carterae.AAC.1